MGKTGKIVAAVVLLAVLAGGGVLVFTKDKAAPPTNNQPSETDGSHPRAVDIVYTGYGFSPDNFALSPPATVNMINESSRVLDLASDPYPTRVDNPELNVGRIAPGKTKTFVITKEGLWGYHNFLEPTEKGRIAVLRGE